MVVLVAGLALFVGLHMAPAAPTLRQSIVERLGLNRYRGLFSLVSAVGLGMIIFGKRAAPNVHVYTPPVWGHQFALWIMPLAFLLVIAAYVPGHTRRVLKHPMMIGLGAWGVGHLLANGDQASLVLFGGLTAFAALHIASHLWRPPGPARQGRLWADAVALGITPLSYGLSVYLHQLWAHPVW